MAEDSADAPEKPNLATNAGQPDEGQIASKKLPYWLFFIPLVIMILQSALEFISAKIGILSYEIVQQTGFLVFMVIGAPILAIMGWQYLIGDSSLRYMKSARKPLGLSQGINGRRPWLVQAMNILHYCRFCLLVREEVCRHFCTSPIE